MTLKSSIRCPPTLNVLLCRFFYSYSFYVYRYRWLFLIVPIILAGMGSSGLYFLKQQRTNDSFYVYTPIKSKMQYERAVLAEHWPLITDRYIPGKFYAIKFRAEIYVQAKDEGNLLRSEYLNETIELNRIILENYSVASYDGLTDVTYQTVCLNWDGECFENGYLEIFRMDDSFQDFMPKVTYPITRQEDAPIYLGSTVGGVKLNETGEIDFVHTFRLAFSMMESPPPLNHYSRQWMIGLENIVLNYKSKYLKLALFHADTFNEGLEENAKRLIPKFTITFLVLTVFCALCSFITLKRKRGENGWWKLVAIDWVRSKPMLAIIGIISSCMSISTSMGIVLLLGFEFHSVVCVMPFLVLSIGVNDMCIMTSAWHRTSMTDGVDDRLAETLAEAAVAISITSFTDVISFAIGAWNSLPAVILFCSYTSVALLVEYIYQITFFSAAMAFFGEAEANGRHCLVPCVKAKSVDNKDLNCFQKTFLCGTIVPSPRAVTESTVGPSSQSSSELVEKETPIMRFFRVHYAPAILNPAGKVLVGLLYCAYLGFAIWGCTKIKEGLEPSNLVPRDHYMVQYVKMVADFWHQGVQAQVVVNHPPDLALEWERKNMLDMVTQFETTPHTMGHNTSMFFLREYLTYLKQMNAVLDNSTDLWYDELKVWVKHTGSSSNWETDLHWDPENETNLLAFRFQVALKNFDTVEDHRETCVMLRELASTFPDYNVTTYHEYWGFADQYLMIRPTVIQDNLTAVAAMIIIAVILIPNLVCAIFITLSMLSINMGCFGYMTWWGVHLDCVSMITMVMALGFAIDYSAHICYAYVSARGESTSKRTLAALETLGWPVFQGALTTIFGTFVLVSVDGYLVQTFFKTVFLSISTGLLHSVIFLPVALATLLPENGIRIREPVMALLARLNVYRENEQSEISEGHNNVNVKETP